MPAAIKLIRKGQRIIIKAGEQFDFTQEELDSIEEVNPGAVRKLVNEAESAPTAKAPVAPKGGKTESKPESKSEDKGDGKGANEEEL